MSLGEARGRITSVALAPARGTAWIGDERGRLARIGREAVDRLPVDAGGAIGAIALSTDGLLILAGADRGAVVVDAAGRLLDTLPSPREVDGAAVLGMGAYVSVDSGHYGLLWSVTADGVLQSEPVCSDGVEPVQFSGIGILGDGSRMTLSTGLGWLNWQREGNRVTSSHEPVDGRQLALLDGATGVSRNGTFWFVYWDDFAVYDTASGREIFRHDPRSNAACGALSDDGGLIVIGGRHGDVFSMNRDGELKVELRPGTAEIRAVDVRPDGTEAAWVDWDGHCGIIDLVGGVELLNRGRVSDLLAG
jgi:hypothetical protein